MKLTDLLTSPWAVMPEKLLELQGDLRYAPQGREDRH